MEKIEIQAVHPAGRFDQLLMPQECNNQMFELFGPYITSPLYKLLAKEDVPHVEKVLERCRQNPDEVAEECVHILAADGKSDVFVMRLSWSPSAMGYYIELMNLSASERLLRKSESEKLLLRDFLTISGGYYFSYSPSDDAFSMFWMDYEQKVVLYSMSLAEWEEQMIAIGKVSGEDAAVFRTFCSAVRKASSEQFFNFHGSFFSKDDRKEAYRVKFVPRTRGGEVLVEGVWVVINERTGNVLEDYTEWMNLDSLTKTLHKNSVSAYAERALEKGENPAIVMVDVDEFKSINDTFGHPFGDQVIVAVADIIKKVVGDHGVVGRVGGDEFMVVLKNCSEELELRNYLRGIRTNVAALFQDRMVNKRISCSIGAARGGIDSNDYRELYRIADRVLYVAKQKGKNRYVIYKPELHSKFIATTDMQEIRDSYYSEKDLNRMNLCLSELILSGREKLPGLLEHAVRLFGADRAVILWGEPREIVAAYPAEYTVPNDKRQLFECMEYRELFEGDMLHINGVNSLEFSLPEIYALYKENNTNDLRQHFLWGSDGEIRGMISVESVGTMNGFSAMAAQLFKNMCRTINAVLLREEKQEENLDSADGVGL